MARRSGDEVAVFISEGAFSETELVAGILMLIGPEKVVKNLHASVEKIQYSASGLRFDADMAVGAGCFYGYPVKPDTEAKSRSKLRELIIRELICENSEDLDRSISWFLYVPKYQKPF